MKVEKNIYNNQRCFILGTGVGLMEENLSLLKNEITIGINLILYKKDFTPNYLCVSDTQNLIRFNDIIFNDRMSEGAYVVVNGCKIADKHGSHGNCNKGDNGSTCSDFKIDPKYKNVYTVKHDEKSGIMCDHIDDARTKLLKTDQYYIDPKLKTVTAYGSGAVDNLAIPLAVYLGFKKIYLLGCDGMWSHFYDQHNGYYKDGRRDWINFKHVKKRLDSYGVKLLNCDRRNAFSELEYKKLEDVLMVKNFTENNNGN